MSSIRKRRRKPPQPAKATPHDVHDKVVECLEDIDYATARLLYMTLARDMGYVFYMLAQNGHDVDQLDDDFHAAATGGIEAAWRIHRKHEADFSSE